MKRKALQKLKGQEVVPASSNPVNDWSKDGNLLEWLNSLGH